jgi:hypothetical protein
MVNKELRASRMRPCTRKRLSNLKPMLGDRKPLDGEPEVPIRRMDSVIEIAHEHHFHPPVLAATSDNLLGRIDTLGATS